MKSISKVALLAVAAVVLAACSSGNESSSSSSSVASSSPAPVSASSTAAYASGSGGTTIAGPAGLDAASTTWFDVLCTKLLVPLHDIHAAHIPTSPVYTSQVLPEDDPTQREADRQARIAALDQTAATLVTTPPPGFDGGAAYAATVTRAIQATSQTVTADPAQGSELSPSGPFHPLDVAISQVDPTVRNYALLIPSCNAAGGLPYEEGSPPATTAAPADLDAASKTWFDVLCTSVASMGGPASTPAELLAGQQAFAATMTRLAAKLAATPPPGFEGGAPWAASVIAVVQYSGATMTASLPQYAADLAALDPKDSAAFQRFKSGHPQPAGLAEGYGVLAGMNTQLDPAIMAAVREIPSCKPLGL